MADAAPTEPLALVRGFVAEQAAAHRLRDALRLAQGFELDLVSCPSPSSAQALIEWLIRQLAGSGLDPARVRTHRVSAKPPVDIAAITRELLEPLAAGAGAALVFLDVSGAAIDDEVAWRWLFQRLNERRNEVAAAVDAPVVVLLPPWLDAVVPTEAPDLWSIRSVAVELVERLLTRADPSRQLDDRPATDGTDLDALQAQLEARQQQAASGLPGDLRAYSVALRRWAEAALPRADLATLHRRIDRDLIPLASTLGDGIELARALQTQAELRAQEGATEVARSVLIDQVLPLLARPEDDRERAITIGRIADFHRILGDASAARTLYEESFEILRRLAQSEPGRPDIQRDLSVSSERMGDLYKSLGMGDDARNAFAESLAIRRHLAQSEPDRADLQRDLSVSYIKMGDLYKDLGRGDDARKTFADALAISLRLAQSEPSRADFQRDLALSYERMGDLYQDLGRGADARKAFADALAIRSRFARSEPDRADFQLDLSASYNRMGDLYKVLGRVPRRADVVVLTAIRLEFDAVLTVDAGAVSGSVWELVDGPSGLPVAFRSFIVKGGRPLRVAVAVAPDMGATAATNTLLPLVEALKPRCIAMCGVCAGRRGKTQLGDVVAADRLYYHDTGKRLPDEVRQDLATYKLRDDWKVALEGMGSVAPVHFGGERWFQERPITTEWREQRALVALRDGVAEPWTCVDPTLDEHGWKKIVASLRERKLLAETGRELTDAGRSAVDALLFDHMGKLPDLSPSSMFQPFRLHVGSLGSGSQVIEDETIWAFVSQAMRKTLALEMEGAALGELAHRQRQYGLDAVVMKGVMDFADLGRDDHFKEFAARASAECLLWFLRERVPTELTAGFDDLLTSGTSPPPPMGKPLPSFLLNARHAVVPWHDPGRTEILADLDAWADDRSRAVAVRLLHAEGGVGKTRLAIEWVRRRRSLDDVAGFLVANPDARWLERLCGLGPPVLIVLDYAESRIDLGAILERVAAFAVGPGPRRRLRLLLLARGDGDWWAALPRQSTAVGALLGGAPPVKLPPLAVTVAARAEVFAEAAAVFAAVRGRSALASPPPALGDPRFERVLYLHMAALAWVEGAAFDAGTLMDVVLDHEERFWVSEGHSGTVDVPLGRELVAASTLRGGLATRTEAHAMCERLTQRGRTRDDDALIALLHNVYERANEPAYLPRLEPDLLGEGMVLRIAAPSKGAGTAAGDSWIDRVFIPGDDEHALATGFTVLGSASATDAAAVSPWMQRLLQTELPTRAVIALRAANAVGQRIAFSTLGDLLADALEQRGSAAIASDLDRVEIPYPTVSMQRVATWRSRMLVDSAPAGDDEAAVSIRARRLVRRGADLRAAGQREAALAATHEAVRLCRALATRNPEAFQPALATSLNNLGAGLSDLGQREAALAATSEAVALYRALATRNPDAFQPDLARSLSNLGANWSDLGQREEALSAVREAVELHRTLATRNPDTFQPDLARSVNNLSAMLSAMGQREAALTAVREAVELHRALAARNPDAFQPDFAASSSNLGAVLSDLGQREAALAATSEAVALYRALATRNPDAFQRDLASTLNNLGNRLTDLGQPEAALAAAREAVELRRTLATRNPDAFQPDLAESLNNLGAMLSALGEHAAALAATLESVEIRRTLATGNPDAFRPGLASSLNNLGNRLSDLGQREAALAATSEAVGLRRTLATRNPDAFQPDLAESLNNLGDVASELGQPEEALAATREAVALYRTLANRNPDAFRPALARSLTNLGNRLTELRQGEPALEAVQEALDLIWPIFIRLPQAHQRLVGIILQSARRCHEALGRALPSGLIERDVSFSLRNVKRARG